MVNQSSKSEYKFSAIGETPEDWQVRKVRDLVNVKGRIGFRGYTKKDLVKPGQGALTIGAKHIVNNKIDLSDSDYISWSKYYESPEIMIEKNDILLVQRGSIGKVALVDKDLGPATINPSIQILRAEEVNPRYLYYFLTSAKFQQSIKLITTSTAVPMISQAQLGNLWVGIPQPFEQTRISSYLSDTDALIESLDALIRKKKNMKQGLMQSLLTRGIGHTKFKMTEIGEIPEEWKLGTLTSVTENENDIVAGPFGSNLKVSDYTNAGVPIIRLQNVAPNSFIFKDIKYIGEEKAKELNYHSFIAGDIVLAKLGDPIGVSCVIPPELPHGIVVSDVVRIRVSDKKVDKHFIVQSLNSSICLQQLRLAKIGSTRPRVNLSDVRNIKLILPALQEQQKIAEILSDTDKEIEALEQKRDKYKLLKMGMMQQLLTGRIRVK